MEHDKIGVHMTHCNQGEYEDICKYGDDEECPALLKNNIVGGYKVGYTQQEVDTERSIYEGKTIEEWAGHKVGIVETSDYRAGFKKGWESNPKQYTEEDIVAAWDAAMDYISVPGAPYLSKWTEQYKQNKK